MNIRRRAAVIVSVALLAAAGRGWANCAPDKLTELPVTITGGLPTVPVRINGIDATFIADSGASYSLISRTKATEFHLSVEDQLPYRLVIIWGFGGASSASYTIVKKFGVGSIGLRDAYFTVAGTKLATGAAGLIGQDILGLGDVEYDLAEGAIRLMHTHECGQSPSALWGADAAHSVVDIGAPGGSDAMSSVAYLNGAKIRVIFDTGASRSMLTLHAARGAGVRPGDHGVRPAGPTFGVGGRRIETWVAMFASFRIGDEEAHNAQLHIGDVSAIGNLNADMVIGADFFLSHRVYVAGDQRKLYFIRDGRHASNPDGPP